MSVVSTRWPATLYLGVLAACGSSSADDSTGPSELRVCQQPVAVRVVRTATLTVSWLPLCRVNQIVFHEPGPSFASPWLAYAPRRIPILSHRRCSMAFFRLARFSSSSHSL